MVCRTVYGNGILFSLVHVFLFGQKARDLYRTIHPLKSNSLLLLMMLSWAKIIVCRHDNTTKKKEADDRRKRGAFCQGQQDTNQCALLGGFRCFKMCITEEQLNLRNAQGLDITQ